jgi:hypothetical protein
VLFLSQRIPSYHIDIFFFAFPLDGDREKQHYENWKKEEEEKSTEEVKQQQ